MKNNIKYVAINMDSAEGRKLMDSSKTAIYEIDADLFTFNGAGFNDYLRAEFAGELADDPLPIYIKKAGQSLDKGNDPLNDKNCYYQVNIISTIDTWYDENGEIHHRSSRSRIVFKGRMKKIIARLHKGDRISGTGNIYSFSERDVEDPRRGRGYWYIEANSVTVNAYKTISKGARDAFSKNKSQKIYRDANEVMSDYTLSKKEKYAILADLYADNPENDQRKLDTRPVFKETDFHQPNYQSPENPNYRFDAPTEELFENIDKPITISNDELKNSFTKGF